MGKNIAASSKECVACGNCVNTCPVGAISLFRGVQALVDKDKCLGCGKCVAACPACVMKLVPKEPYGGVSNVPPSATISNKTSTKKKQRKWHHFMWIIELSYLSLGVVNILFAWLGIILFLTPLLISIIGGSKAYCGKYCGRGQLLQLLGARLGVSLNRNPPKFLRSLGFRYGFLTFFMTMFGLMIYNTVLVFKGASLTEAVTLLWTFKLPWNWADVSFVSPGAAQFAFGFYGVMLTSSVLGFSTMFIFRPRSWCVYCPMGTMTQGICQLRNWKDIKEFGLMDEAQKSAGMRGVKD